VRQGGLRLMQILFLADRVFEDLPGGSRVVARELARGLAQRGHEVTFLVGRQGTEGPDETCREGVRIVRFHGGGSAAHYVRAGKSACAKLCGETPFDVVHTHFAYSALGPLKAVPKTVPQVRSFYGPWHAEGWVEDQSCLQKMRSKVSGRFLAKAALCRLKYVLRSLVERASLKRSRAVIVLSEQSRGEVLALGYPPRHIQKVAGGVDVQRFVPADDKQAVRAALGLPEDRRLLLSVRRLAPRMGLDNLIKAMPAIVARHPDVLLLIGGQGPERGRLERLVADLGLGGHVCLVGFIPDAQLVAYYQSADLFVLPTVALEGFGLVTAEALACGIPVVGTDVGATPEILSGLDTRLIVPGTSPEALAEAISKFLEQDWAKGLTPERLHQFVLEHYQWDQHVEAVEQIYRDLMGADNHAFSIVQAGDHAFPGSSC